MLDQLTEVIDNPDKKLGNLVDKIKRQEQKTDDMEEEIIDFCSQLARSATSLKVGRDVARYLEMANDVERIGDHCMNLVLLAERRWEKKYKFTEKTQNELTEMLANVGEFLLNTGDALDRGATSGVKDAKLLEAKINKMRNDSRKSHARRMQAGEEDVREGLIFLDMMTNLEKIGDYCMNVDESLQEAY